MLEGGLQLVAVGEQRQAAENIEAQAGTAHGYDEATNVSQVADRACTDEREQDVVVLLALVLVHRLHLHSVFKRVRTCYG